MAHGSRLATAQERPAGRFNDSRRRPTRFLMGSLFRRPSLEMGDTEMADVVLIAVTVVFFALAFAFASWMDRI